MVLCSTALIWDSKSKKPLPYQNLGSLRKPFVIASKGRYGVERRRPHSTLYKTPILCILSRTQWSQGILSRLKLVVVQVFAFVVCLDVYRSVGAMVVLHPYRQHIDWSSICKQYEKSDPIIFQDISSFPLNGFFEPTCLVPPGYSLQFPSTSQHYPEVS